MAKSISCKHRSERDIIGVDRPHAVVGECMKSGEHTNALQVGDITETGGSSVGCHRVSVWLCWSLRG